MPKTRKMLSDWEAPYLVPLIRQIETQSKDTLIVWSTGYAEEVLLPIWEKAFPEDSRPRAALQAAGEWRNKLIKLPEAKKQILLCHEAARACDGNPAAQAAARAIGQVASTIHVARHCIGLPLYGELAVAYDRLGADAAWQELEPAAGEECGRMLAALVRISKVDEPNPAKISWVC